MDIELKKLVMCPKCKKGQVIHAGGTYFCNQDNDKCDFIIPGEVFGKKITKTSAISLVKNKIIEPILPDLQVYSGSDPVTGFITLSKYFKVEFLFPKDAPITKCPKCKKNKILMRYSASNQSKFYACEDYEQCKFTIPYIFRGKPFSFKNIIALCSFQKITKTYISKKNKSYTVLVYLDRNEYRINVKI